MTRHRRPHTPEHRAAISRAVSAKMRTPAMREHLRQTTRAWYAHVHELLRRERGGGG